MDSQQVRQYDDSWEHQQNQTPDQRRAAGGHWGPQAGHQTVGGAATAAIANTLRDGHHYPEYEQHAVDPNSTEGEPPHTRQDGVQGVGTGPQDIDTSDALEVICGPLLNYKRMSNTQSDSPIWHGSVLVVTKPGQADPQLSLRCLELLNGSSDTNAGKSPRSFHGEKLYADPKKVFWRFRIDLPIQDSEAKWEYQVHRLRMPDSRNGDQATQFVVPSKTASMRILFHSCNGFSVGTDVDAWSGPALWNDVLRVHADRPFHVMIGGGDQIYNDGVRVDGPLRSWTNIANPKKRQDFPFNEELRQRCDSYYFNNYITWYNHEPFSTANGQIPQLNIWDDHDIIDGFGSYTDHFMRCAVFRGIGGVAHKYYLLFQHHIAPPKSTFTTDAPKTMHAGMNGTPADPVQMKDTFVMDEKNEDPSYIIGPKPGPYVEERSRSLFCQLGARVAFLGIDARTERTRRQINYPETYNLLFDRVSKELAANQNIKHLILLLGVPIAYPRLQWLEQILQSPIIGPIRFLNKRFGLAGNFFNQFDGKVDLLDDLDDHYTAQQHKRERKGLMMRLQALAKQHSVRITILGGDVHLGAIGRFYSNPKLALPAERDWRYMPNIISSAITNKPPPAAVANLLARRNKIHHLDHDTDETLLEIFDRDPGLGPDGKPNSNGHVNGKAVGKKTSDRNHCTMPSRNYAIIAESHDGWIPPPHHHHAANGTTNAVNGHVNGNSSNAQNSSFILGGGKPNPRKPIHAGEMDAGTTHPAATGTACTRLCGADGLDVTLRVEISPSDPQGRTEGYGFSIPALDALAYKNQGETW